MGFLDTLMFWKRKDVDLEPGAPMPGFGDQSFNTGLDNMGMDKNFENHQLPPMPSLPTSPQTPSGYSLEPSQPRQTFSMQDQHDIIMNKNMEIISSKIDALQATIENISQRISNIERIAQLEQQRTMQKRYNY